MKYLFKRAVLDPITHQKERRININARFGTQVTPPSMPPSAKQADQSMDMLTDQLRKMWNLAHPGIDSKPKDSKTRKSKNK